MYIFLKEVSVLCMWNFQITILLHPSDFTKRRLHLGHSLNKASVILDST